MESRKLSLPAASGLLTNLAGYVVIQSARETSGSAAAVYRLWDGTDPGENLILTESLAAGASAFNSIALGNLPFRTGLYFELVSGELEGQISVVLGINDDVALGEVSYVAPATLADLDEH